MRTFVRFSGFLLTLAIWSWVKNLPLARGLTLTIIIGGVLAVLPVVWAGRAMLDAWPATERCEWVMTLVHYGIMIPFGAAIIEAIKLAYHSPGWLIPLPREVGLLLMAFSGVAVVLTVANLALRGLGAPFAIALSRRLATDWLYAWTRNPMVLSTVAFLLALGLWLRSLLFILWVLGLVLPVWLIMLKVYEERELEIRFGASYLEYKARTPMLWPRKPKA